MTPFDFDAFGNPRPTGRRTNGKPRPFVLYSDGVYDPALGRGSIIDLETVTQMALLVAAKALKLTRICRPFVVFLTPSDEVRVPQVLSHNGRNIHVMTDEGVAESVECLREGLKLRTVKAFATARLQSDESNTPASGIEVIAQQFKSGPHRVVAPYTSDAVTGALVFERPARIPSATENAAPSPF